TLLHVISGLDRRYQGKAVVAGVDLSTLGDAQLAQFRNAQVGFVFQHFHLLDHLSCLENVALPAYFAHDAALSPGSATVREQALATLARVGVADKAGALPST